MDIEIDAMSVVAAALADLESEAQARVLRWAAERFGVTLSAPNSRRDAGGGGAASNSVGGAVIEPGEFEHFAELFAAAQPTTNEDKALVAGYWVQVNQGKDKWPSRLLNAELKHLGHSIGNITDALSSNMKRKPQRVIQLKKSGSTQQATKTYKVTDAGLVHVQGMLARSNS
jgi:hypothetical protein